MTIVRIAIRKILITIKCKTGIETVLRTIDTFFNGMRDCRKKMCEYFSKRNLLENTDKDTAYIKSIFKYGRKEEQAIYEKLKSVYKR